ncbi:unnamed protein product [Arabis nemorensis]|uniref:Replication factor A C-terminal domain-containing protein n=1 Tax=Arabis nemorensis TaxID=586526 RepID=A0A565BJV3_9BRAS|nr:unnamed protein product [Arabis nemorensis]
MKEIKNVTYRGRPPRILTLQLRDLMGINVTLWEQFADHIFSYAKSSPSGLIILLGSMMKIHGDISIQSSMFATKLFIDPVVKEISEFKTKFKLQVRVVDHTGTASFLLFDNTLQKLIQKSVNDLLDEQLEFTRSGHFSQELLDLEGRNFVFKVKHTDTTIYKGCAYNVVKLTDDRDTVQKFEQSCSTLTCSDSELTHGPIISARAIEQIDTTSYQSDTKDSSRNSNVQQSNTAGEESNNEGIHTSEFQTSTPSNKQTINLADDEEFDQSSTK